MQINYDWLYGLNSRYFFDYTVVQVETQAEANIIVVDKTDILCTYWDDDKCLSCSGDYYAEKNERIC